MLGRYTLKTWLLSDQTYCEGWIEKSYLERIMRRANAARQNLRAMGNVRALRATIRNQGKPGSNLPKVTRDPY